MGKGLWCVLVAGLLAAARAEAGNIDPGQKYAYCENAGWVNFEPSVADANVGATVTDEEVSGFIWAENIGWINLSPSYGGVTNDGTGLLAGFAWAENAGWINFTPTVEGDLNHYGVTIDGDGNFKGWAWGENIGWINLRSQEPVSYGVRTSWVTDCVVGTEHLAAIANMWMQAGDEIAEDIDGGGTVDMVDYSILAGMWLERCPVGWPLKE